MDERLAYAQVLRLCRKLLRDHGDAEDAAQEVFARAAAAGRDASSLPWLLGVTRHVCLDEYRRRSRAERAMARAAALSPGDAADPEPAAIGSVLLAQLLPHLSPAEGRLLRHRLLTGANLAEAAGDLGITGATARTLAMRLRQKLRPHLPQLGLGPTTLGWLRRFRGRWLAFLDADRAVATATVAAVIAIILGATPTRPDVPALAAALPNQMPPVTSVTPPPTGLQAVPIAVRVQAETTPAAQGPGTAAQPSGPLPPIVIPPPPHRPKTCPPTAMCIERTQFPPPGIVSMPDVINTVLDQYPFP